MKKYHHCVKFTYPLSFQTRIPKVDQHTGGKWLIHGTKHRKVLSCDFFRYYIMILCENNVGKIQYTC